MRPEIALADRRFEVRRAATAWRRAGEIDAVAERAIHAMHADDRVRATPVFRALYFVFTAFGFWTAHGLGLAFLAALGLDWNRRIAFAGLVLGTGLVLAAAAEALTGRWRLRRFGVEEALAWLAWAYTLGGGLWLLAETIDLDVRGLVVAGGWGAAALASGLAWRWAIPGSGFVAAAGLYVALSQAPANWLVWMLVSTLAAWPLGVLALAPHVAPEHRRRFREGFLVTAAALYVGVHVEVFEHRLFFWLRGAGLSGAPGEPLAPPLGLLVASELAMLAIPAALLTAGLRRRFRPAVDLGLVLAAETVASLVARYGWRPLWLVLILAGGALLAATMVLRRALERRAGGEWAGWTARELPEDRDSLEAVEIAATLATLSPAARPVEKPPDFTGRGGEFGGGGASGTF